MKMRLSEMFCKFTGYALFTRGAYARDSFYSADIANSMKKYEITKRDKLSVCVEFYGVKSDIRHRVIISLCVVFKSF